MLTGQARTSLRGVQTVIVDKVHAVASGSVVPTSRQPRTARRPPGEARPAHRPVRTVSPFERSPGSSGAGPGRDRGAAYRGSPGTSRSRPVEDMTAPEEYDEDGDTRPVHERLAALEEQVVDLVERHRSTIVFADPAARPSGSTTTLNEDRDETRRGVALGREPRARHRSSRISRRSLRDLLNPRRSWPNPGPPRRRRRHRKATTARCPRSSERCIEDDLKRRGCRASSRRRPASLAHRHGCVDLVVQDRIEPPSVASARTGRPPVTRSARQPGGAVPKHRGRPRPDRVTVERMRSAPSRRSGSRPIPLNILAQQVVAVTASTTQGRRQLLRLRARSAAFTQLPRSTYDATLDLLSGAPQRRVRRAQRPACLDRVAGRPQQFGPAPNGSP